MSAVTDPAEPSTGWVAGVLGALFVSNTGTFLQTAAQAWVAWDATHDPATLGLLGLVQATPLLGLPLLGGALADRWPRRSVLLATQAALAAVAAATGALAWTGQLTPPLLLALAGVLAAVAAVDNPVRQAYLPGLVGGERRTRVVGLNALAYNAGAVLGPAAAGVLLPRAGAGWCFAANAASYLAALAWFWAGPPGRPAGGAGTSLAEAAAYLRGAPTPRVLLVLVGAVSLLGRSYTHVLPALVGARWGGGPTTYGTLAAVPGLGAVGAAALVAWAPGPKADARLRWGTAAGLGVAIGALGVAPTAAAAGGVLLAVGLLATGTMTLLNAGLQHAVPDRLRGRASSLYTVLAAGMPPAGGWALGTAMKATGGTAALVAAGALLATAALALGRPPAPGESERTENAR